VAEDLFHQQLEVCRRYGVPHVPAAAKLKVGISRRTHPGVYPLNGLRHLPEGDTTGWYLWAGEELGAQDDFFVPLHVEHLQDHCPEVLPFLVSRVKEITRCVQVIHPPAGRRARAAA